MSLCLFHVLKYYIVDSCVGKSVECMCEVECMLSFRLSVWEADCLILIQRQLSPSLSLFLCTIYIYIYVCFLVCAIGGLRHWKCGRQALWLI